MYVVYVCDRQEKNSNFKTETQMQAQVRVNIKNIVQEQKKEHFPFFSWLYSHLHVSPMYIAKCEHKRKLVKRDFAAEAHAICACVHAIPSVCVSMYDTYKYLRLLLPFICIHVWTRIKR